MTRTGAQYGAPTETPTATPTGAGTLSRSRFFRGLFRGLNDIESVMNLLAAAIALFLLLNIAAGLIRVLRGPTRADQMLVAQLLGTTGVAILLLLAEALRVPALRDVALVLAMLAATATVVFVRLVWVPSASGTATFDVATNERGNADTEAGGGPPDA